MHAGVLEQQDRLVPLDGRAPAVEHPELGAFDVDLDQPHRIVADEVVEAADGDVDLDRLLAGDGILAVQTRPRRRADDVEERRRAVVVGQRALVDRHVGEVAAEVLGEVGSGSTATWAPSGAASTHHAVISPGVGTDIDRRVARTELAGDDPVHRRRVAPDARAPGQQPLDIGRAEAGQALELRRQRAPGGGCRSHRASLAGDRVAAVSVP